MKSIRLWVLSSFAIIVLAFLLACSSASPKPTPSSKPTPAPTATATTTKPAATPSPAATTKPTATVKPTATSSDGVNYAGKTVQIIVATSAGGGTDILTRLWAKYLPRFLPGNPTVIVRNMPGGSGTVGANYAYESKPDGLTMLVGSGTAHMAFLMGMSAVKFDLRKVDAILANSSGCIFVTKPSVATRAEDFIKSKNVIFGSSPGTMGYIFVTTVEVLNIPAQKIVTAYGGTGDARRAFLSGETNTTAETASGYSQALEQYVKSKEALPLFQAGLFDEKGNEYKDAAFPPVPTVAEVYQSANGKPPSGIAWEAYKTIVATGRGFSVVLLPPVNTPPNVLNAWWMAADKMVKDPGFQKDVEALVGTNSTWRTGKSLADDYKAKMMLNQEVITWLKDTFGKKYGISLE